MKIILSILFFAGLCFYQAAAQHYSCMPAEQKVYYTNARGYLRGMHTDSVKIIEGNTVHYPFLTARTNFMDWAAEADTTGGSWWGRQVIESPEGRTVFINYHGDTIHIHNTAQPGDSWIFFSDTSAIHYTAEVTSADTLTVGLVTDSVKVIQITARDESGLVVPDSLNGAELLLSKHSGLVTAIDFYLFPYRQFRSSAGVDCYFFEAMGQTVSPGKGQLVFNRVDFKVPYGYQIFNFDTGFIYFSGYYYSSGMNNGTSNAYTKNLITGKTHTPTGIVYHYDFWRKTTVQPPNAGPVTYYDSGFNQILLIKDDLLMDTTYMPEQWYSGKVQGTYIYYLLDDSSFCHVSPRYHFHGDVIIDNKYGGGGPEPSFPVVQYKEGIGEVRYDPDTHIESPHFSRGIDGAKVATSQCYGDNTVLSLTGQQRSKMTYQLYPNPARDFLYITGDKPFSADIFDVMGKKLFSSRPLPAARQQKVDVGNFPAGVYFLKISDGSRVLTRKVLIQH